MLLLIVLVLFLVIFFLAGGTIDALFGETGRLALVLAGALILFIGMGTYVAAALGGAALIIATVFTDRPLQDLFGQIAWGLTGDFVFVAVPLFILMGTILERSGMTAKLYSSLAAWVTWLPGGLLHTNIVASGLFAAVSGSSMATAATVGSMALPFFRKGRYNERLVLGSLAAGGTLGILIPPSLKMIWYALLTENSIGRMFLAGIVPGLILVAMFMAVIAVIALLWPGVAPREPGSSWRARAQGIPAILPLFALIIVVLGSIYVGFATPTEAAALGVTMSMVIAAVNKQLTLQVLREATQATARITAMVALIVIFATIFSFVIGALGLPQAIASVVTTLDVNPYVIVLVIIVFYVVAGTFLDDVALTFATIPVIYPIVRSLGAEHPDILIFNGTAFGILFVVLMEMAIISPPDGINLYVIHGLRKRGSMMDVFVGVMPFIACQVLFIMLLVLFPQIALWLPNLAMGGN